MNQSKISVRYAKALFQLAKEKQLTGIIKEDMIVVQTIAKSVEEFQLLIESPTIKVKKKQEIFELIFGKSVNKITLDFLLLILKNKRELHIADIARNFLDIARKELGVKSASFVSVVDIDKETAAEIQQTTEKFFKTKIDLIHETNPDLIGGYILRVEDQQFDASVATKLNKIKRHLLSSSFEVKY
ncbi:MAG: ATP synthase F1 subunit delta [Bacteroidota bacterium]|nr:ATP synthase F1 subunit delta [Bacteroidota bacterium]